MHQCAVKNLLKDYQWCTPIQKVFVLEFHLVNYEMPHPHHASLQYSLSVNDTIET